MGWQSMGMATFEGKGRGVFGVSEAASGKRGNHTKNEWRGRVEMDLFRCSLFVSLQSATRRRKCRSKRVRFGCQLAAAIIHCFELPNGDLTSISKGAPPTAVDQRGPRKMTGKPDGLSDLPHLPRCLCRLPSASANP